MAEDKKKEEIAVIDITEEYLKERIYEIRGQRVILDADLSEIYGYTTKAFNQQVKNNIEKFDEDFMFELTDDEVENLRSNFLTANLNSKSRYNPHVFTEQGLYKYDIFGKSQTDGKGTGQQKSIRHSAAGDR